LSPTLADHVRPGDTVVIGQATAEPPGLVAQLMELAHRVDRLTVFFGYSINPAWDTFTAGPTRLISYCALGALGGRVTRGEAEVIPCHLSQLSRYFAVGLLQADVVLLQVSAADEGGFHSLGCTADYVLEAARTARVVAVEVNPHVPRLSTSARLHSSEVIVLAQGDAPLLEIPAVPASEVQRAIGRQVAQLVPDGASVQLGIGGFAAAMAAGLYGHRGLRIRSGMVGDWLVDLAESGALDTSQPTSVLTSMVVGSARLYDFAVGSGLVEIAPIGQLLSTVDREHWPLMAVNSAIEVDTAGQVNAETLGDRYVGALGGQGDYFRAARRTDGGLAILALAATAGRDRHSRIVDRVASGRVTTLQSDVDFIVTEHGCADLRVATQSERYTRITQIADSGRRESTGG
jgi:acyl-CoA hydrolase